MICPYCAHFESQVIDSRGDRYGHRIRRRRECDHCHKRFTTYEFHVTTLSKIMAGAEMIREALGEMRVETIDADLTVTEKEERREREAMV